MTLDKERYEAAAGQRRVDFIIKVVLFAGLIIASGVVIALMYENITATLAGAVALVWFIFSLVRVIKNSHPRELFSDEYEGKVVKVHINEHSAARRTPKPATAELYIAKSATEVVLISGLPSEAAECYRKGDRVLHIKGTLAPVILDRDISVIPCPVCAKTHIYRQNSKCPHCNS